MARLTTAEKKRIQQAAEYAQSDDFRQALDAIDGIHHPKVDQLRQALVKKYRAKIAEEVAPARLSKPEFKPSEPILLLDEINEPRPQTGKPLSPTKPEKSRWTALKKWLSND